MPATACLINAHSLKSGVFYRRNKSFYFTFEALGSFACGFYANYIFFLLRDNYGFGNIGNLGVSSLQGLVWALAAWRGGLFAQRCGYFTALRTGLLGMIVALAAGIWLKALAVQIVVLVVWTASSCYVWPALEGLVSEGESEQRLPRQLGIYNVTWATCSALSYFLGGNLFQSLGSQSIFWLPITIYIVQLGLLAGLNQKIMAADRPAPATTVETHSPELRAFEQPVPPRTFLRMAWLANPFSCIGINVLLATIPSLARDLHLSIAMSGWFCSIWFFARLGAFILLWQWQGWHYHFYWLISAFVGLMAGLAVLLLSHDLWMLSLAQVVFGVAVGLIYYSSLFYSMDVGQTKGEHGGLHEAAMGAGNFLGPAIGMTALLCAPGNPHASAYAMSGLLGIGLLGLLRLRFLPATARNPCTEKP
jgi:predicted MFS family arabinose efflux permease